MRGVQRNLQQETFIFVHIIGTNLHNTNAFCTQNPHIVIESVMCHSQNSQLVE